MIGLVRLALPLALEGYPGFGSYEAIGPIASSQLRQQPLCLRLR